MSEETEPNPGQGTSASQPATEDTSESGAPEGADPGPPTMDYFEKGEKPSGEAR